MKFVFSFDTLHFYFNGTNRWAVEKDNDSKGLAYIADEQDFVKILPLLKMEFSDFMNKIQYGLFINFNGHEYEGKENTFPLYNLLCTALFSNSEYWVKLALHWVPFVRFNLREELIKASMNSNYSQSVRHHAKKLAYAN